MLSVTETWSQQTRSSCLDVCAVHDNPIFINFAERALKALLADELRRYTLIHWPRAYGIFGSLWLIVGKKSICELLIQNPPKRDGAPKAQ